MDGTLITYREAGRQLGVSHEVVSAIVRGHGLTPKPFPSHGRAKGLDGRDMAVIRKALGHSTKRDRVPA